MRFNGHKVQKMVNSGSNVIVISYTNNGNTISRTDTIFNYAAQIGFVEIDRTATPCWLLALQIAAYSAALPEVCVNPISCAVTFLALVDKIKTYDSQGCYIFDPVSPIAFHGTVRGIRWPRLCPPKLHVDLLPGGTTA